MWHYNNIDTYGDGMVLEFLQELTNAGYRIFSVEDAREIARDKRMPESSIKYILNKLLSVKAIRPLFRGHYAVEDNLLSGSPLHKFEIAQYLAKEGAICCWSAMAFHELTDQVLFNVYVYAPYENEKSRFRTKYKIGSYTYLLIQTKKEKLWGIERKLIGEYKIRITDLERTLIDGLINPHYCGGFREVLSAFEIAKPKMNVEKIIGYSKKCPISVQKRLGWILSQLSVQTQVTSEITASKYYDKLDPFGPRRGKYNKQWMVMENF